MELTDSLKILFVDTARSLKGRARRLFMARTVKALDVRFISSLPVKRQSFCTAWADKRLAQIVGDES